MSDHDGGSVRRGDVVIVAGRTTHLLAHALASTIHQLRYQHGCDVDPELLVAHAALVDAAAVWRANMRTRDEAPPVMLDPMTTADVAAVLGVSTRAVQRLAARGSLPHQRSGRRLLFDPADVERAVETRRSA